ncbi:MAG TPA: GNAT family N-acetyltransferase [Acidimicrobiia bacterium]|nr:GNAT family N-acetyltransferase [Acidimicrobiia bacterium]
MEIRHARPGEGTAISKVRVDSWKAAYRDLMPAEILDRMEVDGSGWEAAIESATPRTSLLVVDDEGEIVGFSVVGPDRDGAEGAGEIVAIYLLSEVWDRGYGWALMEHSVAELREHGFRRAVLWVLSTNERARRFYETAAWLADGGEKVELWHGHPLPHVRYSRDLM